VSDRKGISSIKIHAKGFLPEQMKEKNKEELVNLGSLVKLPVKHR